MFFSDSRQLVRVCFMLYSFKSKWQDSDVADEQFCDKLQLLANVAFLLAGR